MAKGNSYKMSNGEYMKKSVIDRKVYEAKEQKINQMLDEHGYVFCEDCGVNANAGLPIDCSHDESVDSCQKNGKAEKSFDVNNITMRCRKCHQKHDGLGLGV